MRAERISKSCLRTASAVPWYQVSWLKRLFGGPNLHPAGVEGVKIIGAGDMAVQGDRIELGQHGNMMDAGIDAVADGDIDQAVFASDRDGWLWPGRASMGKVGSRVHRP